MKKHTFLSTLLALALAACGGDANTGSNGTGIRPPPTDQMAASGPLTALGPLGVAGTSLDDAGTTVLLNTTAARPAAELRLGMLTDAEGLVAPSTGTGFATTAVAQSLVLGPVTAVDAARRSLRVMGLAARADVNTLLEGVDRLGEIVIGDWAEIHGLRLPANEGMLATRIVVHRAVTDRSVEVLGTVGEIGAASITAQGLRIDLTRAQIGIANPAGITVSPPGVNTLGAGTLVRVRGTYDPASGVIAATLVTTGFAPARVEGRLTYVEGIVLEQSSGTRFKVGELEADVTGIAAAPAVGARVRLRGRMQAEVLRVDQLAVVADGAQIEYTVEGPITTYVALNDFTVRGERIDASQARFVDGGTTDLGQGRRVRVEGVAGPGRITAREVTILR
jgi:hypothetical protein